MVFMGVSNLCEMKHERKDDHGTSKELDKQYGIVISQIYAPVCMYTHTQIATLSFIEKIEIKAYLG